ncbi:hypothetical protein K9N50_05510 [bacterium]|nr:hypothetical protein [bacterium]
MDLSNYQAVINHKYLKQYPERKVRIKETDRSAQLKIVEITGFQSETNVVFSFDEKPPLSDYISCDGGYRKRCDAVIITNYNDANYLLFIELKSKSIKRLDIENKFKSSECFINYIDSILKCFHSDNLLDSCQKRFIVFCQPPPLNKTPTNAKPQHYRKIGNAICIPYTGSVLLKQILNRQVN